MFNQLDTLGMPAAGIKQLDFPMEVQSLFQEMLVPSQNDPAPAQLGMEPAPIEKKPNVRVYGSEEDMYALYFP